MNESELFQKAMQELKRMKAEHGFVRLDLDPSVLMAVIGALQLAMRHSGFKQRPSYQTVAKVVEDIFDHLERYPALRELLRRGGLQEYDEEGFDG